MRVVDFAIWGALSLVWGTPIQGQTLPAYPCPVATDGAIADPGHHKLLFEDPRVRLTEFSLLPGETTRMHGHPYPAVIAIDSPHPQLDRKAMDATASERDIVGGYARAPVGSEYPYCKTAGPEAPTP